MAECKTSKALVVTDRAFLVNVWTCVHLMGRLKTSGNSKIRFGLRKWDLYYRGQNSLSSSWLFGHSVGRWPRPPQAGHWGGGLARVSVLVLWYGALRCRGGCRGERDRERLCEADSEIRDERSEPVFRSLGEGVGGVQNSGGADC